MRERNENGPFAGRIRQHLDRITQARLEIFDEGKNKRPHPTEPTDGLDNAKRIRLGAEIPTRAPPPPLPPGPNTVAQLFTLTPDPGLTGFDVTQLPIDLVVKITLPVLHRIEQSHLEEAINHVRSRYLSLSQEPRLPLQGPPQTTGGTEEEEEDYEPNFQPTEDPEQIRNKNDALPPEDALQTPTELALGPFKLPQPPPLRPEETKQIGKGTISRVFDMMNVLDEPLPAKRQKPGLNRLAGSNYDREAWITVITRLATRASAGLEDDSEIDEEEEKSQAVTKGRAGSSLAEGIRETLWKYVIEDFRARMGIAISWLNEEWYNDRLRAQAAAAKFDKHDSKPVSQRPKQQQYDKWVLKVLDGILPYLEPKDKVLIRFLSEIPFIDLGILDHVKTLAKDPERVSLAVNAIQYVRPIHSLPWLVQTIAQATRLIHGSYLILVRPPVRDLCIDALEDLWRNCLSSAPLLHRPDSLLPFLSVEPPNPNASTLYYIANLASIDEDAKHATTKLLLKWRPHILPAPDANPALQPHASHGSPATNGIISPNSDSLDIQNNQATTREPSAAFESKTEKREGSSVIAAMG